jgi:hypothetical protein
VYLLAFLIVGQPFDYYWGFPISPMLGLVAAYALEEMAAEVRGVAGDVRPARSIGV